MKTKLSPRLALVIIAGLFVVPLAAAWLMYSGTFGYNPVNTRNLGELVQPPVPVPLDALRPALEGGHSLDGLREHWVLAYALPDPCGAGCTEDVTALRQVHRATGRNQHRIRILLLGATNDATSHTLVDIYPDFLLADAPESEFRALVESVAARSGAGVEGSLYLLDPLGNIMLFYAAGWDPNDPKKDLKRLLTWSKLDEQ